MRPARDMRFLLRVARLHWSVLLLLLMGVAAPIDAQQVADTAFRPPIKKPAYPVGKGPVVLIDEAHFNFHTATGRYLPFSELLRRDGYVVNASAERFTAKSLRAGRVLVIANALNERQNDPEAPPLSAFTAKEVAAVRDWVAGGGSLLLIVDHTPYPGAADDLAKAFGVRFRNGVAADPKIRSGRLVFRRSDGTLMDHPVTKDIDSVATFSGSSFQVDAAGQPLLVFGPEVYSYTQPNDSVSVKGHLQGRCFRSARVESRCSGRRRCSPLSLPGRTNTRWE